MTSRDITYRVGVRDRASGPLRRIGRSLENLKRQAAFQRLSAGLRGFGAGIGGVARRVAGLTAALTGLSGVAGLAGGALLLKRYAEQTDELAKFSRQIGFTVQSYRELQFVAERQGVTQEQLKSSMTAMTKRLGEMKKGTGSLYSFLKKSNPQLLKQLKGVKSNEEAFGILLGALERIEDPMERAALAAAIFSRSGVVMTRVAEAGAKGIAAYRAEFRRLAGTMTKEDAANAEKYQDAITDLSKALGGIVFETAKNIIPQITPRIKSLTDVLADNRVYIGEKVGETVKSISESLESIDWKEFATDVGETASALGSFAKVLGGSGLAMVGLMLLRPASTGMFAFAGAAFLLGKAVHSAGDLSGFVKNIEELSLVDWGIIAGGVGFLAVKMWRLAAAMAVIAISFPKVSALLASAGIVGGVAYGGKRLLDDKHAEEARLATHRGAEFDSMEALRSRPNEIEDALDEAWGERQKARQERMRKLSDLGLSNVPSRAAEAMERFTSALKAGFLKGENEATDFAGFFTRTLDLTAAPKVDTTSIDQASSSVDRLRRNLIALSQFNGANLPAASVKTPPVKTPKGYAKGGRFFSGEPMIVGERGMELIVPNTGGTVINHRDLLDRAIRAGAVGANATEAQLRKVLARLEIVMPNAPKGTRLAYAESEPLFGAPRLRTGKAMGGV